MTPMEAWHIISANLVELYELRRTDSYKGYTDNDIQAEVLCFGALTNFEEIYKRGINID